MTQMLMLVQWLVSLFDRNKEKMAEKKESAEPEPTFVML